MEFGNFFKKGKEKVRDASKKAALVAGIGLVSAAGLKGEGVAGPGTPETGKTPEAKTITTGDGREENVPVKSARFIDRLKEFGILEKNYSEEDFSKLSEEEMQELGRRYVEASGAITRDQLPKDRKYETISRTIYGIDEKEREEIAGQLKASNDKIEFEAWFAKQPEGTVQVYKGKKYKIERSSKVGSVPPPDAGPGDLAMGSTKETEKFIYLKDKDFKNN